MQLQNWCFGLVTVGKLRGVARTPSLALRVGLIGAGSFHEKDLVGFAFVAAGGEDRHISLAGDIDTADE